MTYKVLRLVSTLGALVFGYAMVSYAQLPAESPSASVVRVPRLIPVNGRLIDHTGHPLSGVVNVRFSLYRDQLGGAPLWTESQNLQLDEQGNYRVLMGAYSGEGLPLELFTSAESRWLGVQAQVAGEEESPRVLLVSVPYALKAADADTLGGRPAAAYLLAPTDVESSSNSNTATKIRTEAAASDGSSGDVTSNVQIGTPADPITNSLTVKTNDFPVMYLSGNGLNHDSLFQGLSFYVDTTFGNVWDFARNTNNAAMDATLKWTGEANVNAPFIMQGSTHNVLINSANVGNVGIGTASPSTRLEVLGTAKATTFSGSGAALTDIPNTATTATSTNTANAIVARDASGNFSAGTITGTFSGNGAALANVNAASVYGVSGATMRTRGIVYLAGCETCTTLADTDDQPMIYVNVIGPMQLNSVSCFSDSATPPTVNLRKNGSVTDIIPGNLTCNGSKFTTSLPALALDEKLDFFIGAANGAKRITLAISTTVN